MHCRPSRALYCTLALLLLLYPPPIWGDEIAVRFLEGVTHGFLSLSTDDGRKIADGDSQQWVEGDRVTSHLTIHFKDGSVYDDDTVFSQQKTFHLIADHLIEKGPSFKTPMETFINTSRSEITVHYRDGKGREKSLTKHMDMPPDIANGLTFVIVKDINPNADTTAVSYVAATPQPRLVKLVFKRQAQAVFSAGQMRTKAEHFVMSVDIGGIAGVIAPLIGKKPANTDIWVIGGNAPSFAASRGPLYGDGPVWRINLVSPVLVSP